MAEPSSNPPAAQPKVEVAPAVPAGQSAPASSEGVAHEVQPTSAEPGVNPMGQMITFFLPIMILMYLFMIRPENKRRKEAEQLRNSIKVNDEVVTIAGVYGTVSKIDGDEIVLVVDPKKDVKMRFRRSAIDTVIQPEKSDKK